MSKTETFKPRRSELSVIKKNTFLGAFNLILGIALVVVGIPFIAAILGIFVIFGGLIFIAIGSKSLIGHYTADCPYCGHPVDVGAKATTIKCIHCKKTSTKTEKFLQAID